jgi:serine phosphatase RsbU (regulator of sigma subunit)
VVVPGSFVTALAVHLGADRTTVAAAGHPPPLLITPSSATALDVPTGLPLALETGRDEAYEAVDLVLPPDALLLLHTDGLGTPRVARAAAGSGRS